jgi:hypothetical protein
VASRAVAATLRSVIVAGILAPHRYLAHHPPKYHSKKTRPDAEPCGLDAVVEVFEKWLALKDKTPLYAMLGTVVANLLPGDPVWLGIIA